MNMPRRSLKVQECKYRWKARRILVLRLTAKVHGISEWPSAVQASSKVISSRKSMAGYMRSRSWLVAATQPHAAFAAFTHCLQGQWTFLSRAMSGTSDMFRPLEEVIRADFIRALLRRDVN